MLRTAMGISLRPLRVSYRVQRSFVSTVLLSKTYENKTVAELRTELRARGLSATGNKASLISRIKHADVRAASEVQPSIPTPSRAPRHAPNQTQTQTRNASNAPASTPKEVPAPKPDPTPVSSSSSSSPASPVKFDIKLPDASQEAPEPPVQIPFVPDFWESSAKHAEEAAATASSESSVPKIMLVASASTYPAGGPTYALSPAADILPSTEPPSPPRHYDGLFGDILDDLGIPHNVLSVSPPSTSTEANHELTAKRTHSRPLDEEERRGAITLAALLFGAWIVAGIAAPPTSKNKKKQKRP